MRYALGRFRLLFGESSTVAPLPTHVAPSPHRTGRVAAPGRQTALLARLCGALEAALREVLTFGAEAVRTAGGEA